MADTQTLVIKLQKSARNVARATRPAQREAAQGYLIARASELVARRDELEQKIEQRWQWLDANDPGTPYSKDEHTAQFVKRENSTIELLHEYEMICNALEDAKTTWLHGDGEAA